MDMNLLLGEMGQRATVCYPIPVLLQGIPAKIRIFMYVFYCNVLAKDECMENMKTCGHPAR